jgi:hypothetical protein
MRYETFFEISQKHADWGQMVLPPIIMLLVGALGFLLTKNQKNEKRNRLFLLAFVVLGFLFYGLTGWSSLSGDSACRRALEKGDYSVVEGAVSDFKPMPYEGHAEEQFRVNEVHFSYSDYEDSPGFNRTASHGGPIREGMTVRITYSDTCSGGQRCILKLEIQH